ncbi:DNA polymerase III subunit gamma and tau [Sciscionella sediminilitoris]|uniref:DNA polymerase III subunit gamma and tau n=1 Tax=Sciscionella sediminilitoris TaxID=1445613 RepID=UPI000AA1962C|nr:DNA polymerase III subunit gamma and tau [Sciscionella sp. SE31]
MVLALYRKYRPATFAQVVGQEHVTEPLRASLRAGRINHAYLFSGPRGCGKTSSARILARSLNCAAGPTDEPCGECNSCIALAPNGPGSVDVVELDAASHGGVDDARELRDKAFYAPAESRYRVFVVDEAHMVTTQGFNALLKIVEEPPEHLIFIFATTEPDKVLPTIRSRTHHYPFRLIPPKPMRALLEKNCEAEGIPVEPAVYPLVIRAGGGSARDTQSVLDQLLAGAGPDGVTYERAVALLGVTDVTLLDSLVDGLAATDGSSVFGTVERVVEAGHDPRRFASDLLDRFRDLLLLQAVPGAAERGLVAVPEDQLATMDKQARDLGQATLTRYAEILHTGLTEMRGATAPRLLLELLCSRMLLPSSSDTESAVLQRVERLERRVAAGVPAAAAQPGQAQEQAPPERPKYQRPSERAAAAPAPEPAAAPAAPEPPAPEPAPEPAVSEPAPEPAAPESAAPEPAVPQPEPVAASTPEPAPEPQPEPAPRPEPAPEPEPVRAPDPEPVAGQVPPTSTGTMDAAGVRSVWSEVTSALRERSRPVQAMLAAATVQSVEGNTIVLAHPAAPLVRRLSEPHNVEVVAAALTDALGGTWQVRWVHGDAAAPAQQAAPPKQKPSFEPPKRTQRREPDPEPPPPEPEPEPPEPPEPMDDESMLAEAARPMTDEERANQRTPEDEAIDLLTEHLGARKIGGDE